MTDMPWQGDACSLVDAFRRHERTPREELDATLAAIDAGDLNAFSHVHREQAMAAYRSSSTSVATSASRSCWTWRSRWNATARGR